MPHKDLEKQKEYQREYYKKKWAEDPLYKETAIKQNKEWYQKNKEYSKQKHRNHKLLRAYNITIEDYDKLFEEQKGVCGVCKKPESSVDSRQQVVRRLAVDHCHSTGKVRGLLCQACNTTLGKVEERADILLAMVEYLRKHQ